jgi:Protein of unknown function (DUF3300)
MTNIYIRVLSCFMVFLLIMPIKAMPQDTEESAPSATFTKEELDQMLAPIALYPDSLLSQILMASTYPIEVVDADRWINQNPNLTGDQLDEALKNKDWDVSVKSLCHFPRVLSAMSQNLDQTTKLGNAFLNQQQDVMDTIQELRDKAQAQGNLNTTEQQRVVVEQGDIEIEPVNPDVIYVPMYDPAVVYGPWWYPAYPPYVWYPGVAIGVGISFGVGFFVGAAVGSWCGFDWRHHHVNVDIHRTTVFNNVHIHNVQGGWHTWEHNPAHRMGVAYWNKSTSQRFGQSTTRSTGFRNQFRGYEESNINRQGIPQRQFQQNRGGGRPLSSTRGVGHESAFSGINNWNSEHMAGQRGQTSRGQGFGGGGSHGGGRHR